MLLIIIFPRFIRVFLWIFYSICCSVKWHWFLSLKHRLTFQIARKVEIFEISQSHTLDSPSLSHTLNCCCCANRPSNFNFMQSPHAVCTYMFVFNYNTANCNNQMCNTLRTVDFLSKFSYIHITRYTLTHKVFNSIQRICDKIKRSFFEQKRTRLKLSILTQIDELKSYTN